ncbi:hypothetical protein [Sphingomonas sp. Marseille-Q8236]
MNATDALASQIIELRGNRKKPSDQYMLALGAAIAELVRAASYAPVRPCFRPMDANTFTPADPDASKADAVGYQSFKRVMDDMQRNGFARIDAGKRGFNDILGVITRIYATPKLTDHLATHGITPANRRSHFTYPRAADDIPPIQLRATSKRKGRNRERGALLPVDWTNPAVKDHARQIREINRHYAKQVITGPNGEELDIALYRGFNLGDQPGHDFKKGGRAYADFQSLEREERRKIKINGQETLEVDISACFLTLLHFLLGKSFSNNVDLYDFSPYPREIVKSWVNLTIGNSGYHKAWPKETVDFLEKNKGIPNVRARFSIDLVRDNVLKNLPIIKEWVDSSHSWADLFYIESTIVIDAVHCLAYDHGITALPVHDAIRAPVDYAAVAKAVLSDMFFKNTNIRPIIK